MEMKITKKAKDLKKLADSLNFNEKELIEWVRGVGSVLVQRFSKDLMKGKITFPEALKMAVTKYTEIQQNIGCQLLNDPYKLRAFQNLLLDKVYNSFNE